MSAEFLTRVRNNHRELQKVFTTLKRVSPNHPITKALYRVLYELGQSISDYNRKLNTKTTSVKDNLVKYADILDEEGNAELANVIDILIRGL